RTRRPGRAAPEPVAGDMGGSLPAAIIAGLLLRSRNRVYDRIAQQERPDGGPEGYPPLSRGDRRRTDCG
ncbi:MAG: hypothetical protein M3Q38_01745, partial [Chloroflexota bacterium]|nr:hypothetical protein [Chloroflexota bacterium]